jgi:diketogulonate reductase-like aldo/keto reductase
MQIHWPCTDNTGPTIDPPLTEVWQGLEKAYDEGKAKAIGVSNYSTVKLQETLSSARIAPHVNQVEVHVGFRNDRQFDFCSKHNIHVSAYSPLGSQARGSEHPMEMDEVKTVAKRHNATVGPIMLAYVVAKGASVLPKTTKAERIEENLGALKIKLSSEDLKQLDGVKQVRTIPGRPWLKPETGPLRTLEDLWDGELDCDEC